MKRNDATYQERDGREQRLDDELGGDFDVFDDFEDFDYDFDEDFDVDLEDEWSSGQEPN